MTGMIEKIYSQALFELGTEDNSLDTLYNEVIELADVFNANPELIKFLSAPTISVVDKFSVIERIFKGKVSEKVYNFLCILVEKKRTKYLVRIAAELKVKYNEYNGVVEMVVTTTMPIKTQLRQKLIQKLEQTTGKKVNLVEKVDKSILGGIILNYGNTQMDSSVKSRLDAVYAQMKAIIA